MTLRMDGLDVVALVACPECGRPRPVHPHYVADATTRRCQQCGLTTSREKQARLSADVDEMAVARLTTGAPVRATRGEITEAVRILTERRLPAHTIAERLNVTRRTVERHRARLRTH